MRGAQKGNKSIGWRVWRHDRDAVYFTAGARVDGVRTKPVAVTFADLKEIFTLFLNVKILFDR